MPDACAKIWTRLQALLQSFRSDKSGQILIIFALSSLAIFTGLGASIDLATALAARQRLSEVATLTCQYSTRPSISQTAASNYSGTNGFTNYVTAVNAFATTSLATQHWTNPTPTGASGTVGSYFTATAAAGGATGNAAAAAPTNPVVEMSANIPTAFAKIIHVTSIPVHTRIACETLAYAPQIVNPPTLLKEGFETPCGSYCFYNPAGSMTYSTTASNSFPASAGYTGYNGYQWYIMGYCLETDHVGQINSSVPEGTQAAELDCDNGSGTKGNSSISTKLFLEAGQYELRYFYRSRIDYPNYDPTYICGSTANDVSWANDTSGISPVTGLGVSRTNQINVYLDANLAGTNGTTGSAPLHHTLDGTQSLAGSNLIDMCVYSPRWVERSVRVKVTNPGYYWLSFAADGTSDSYGGQLDNIRFCQELCAGTPQDNFPTSWLAANNGGVNKVLLEDTFEAPVYTQDPYVSSAHTKGGNLSNSLGVNSTSTCNSSLQAPAGWPCQAATGWATAPYNEVVYWEQGALQGKQYISLQGWNPTTTSDIATYGYTNSGDPLNRSISRSFLLDPGYYSVNYNYNSLADFSYDLVYSGGYFPVCTANPTTVYNYTTSGTKHGYDYGSSTLISQYISTDFMNVYFSNGQLVSTPASSHALGSATTYSNPDGTTSLSPTVPLDNGSNFASYNAAAVNPVIDTCYYSSGFGWIQRSINIKITKPGLYWLTFSALGDPLTGTGDGPALDDVKLTALGSPYMSSPPASPLVPIPVPDPQPDTSYAPGTYGGFTIVADPFTPPGADQ